MGKLFKVVVKSDGLWYTISNVKLQRINEKIDELVDILKKRESDDDKSKNAILWVLAIIGVVAAVAGIAYAVYRFVTPDYLEDFEDDFDDDFDDYFEDEEGEEE